MINQLVSYLKSYLQKHFKLLSVLVIAMMIGWFLLPLIGVQNIKFKIIFMCAMVVICFFGICFYRVMNRYRSKRLLAIGDDVNQGVDQLQQLKKEFIEGLKILTHHKIKHKRLPQKSFAALPIFLLLGQTNSGKTEAVKSSGFDFPLQALSDNSQAQCCAWWFTDKAIFIEIRGEVISSKDDKLWELLISLLKKLNRKKPINAMIYTLAIDYLMQTDDNVLTEDIKHYKLLFSRLNKIIRRRLPILTLITKMDVIPGFDSYDGPLLFNDQFECVFDQNVSDNGKYQKVYPLLNDLVNHAHTTMLTRIVKETNSTKRWGIYCFPQKLEQAINKINYGLTVLFKVNPYLSSANYFSVAFSFISTQRSNVLSQQLLHKLNYQLLKQEKSRTWRNSRRFVTTCAFVLMVSGYVLFDLAYTRGVSLLSTLNNQITQMRETWQLPDSELIETQLNDLSFCVKIYFELLHASQLNWFARMNLFPDPIVLNKLYQLLNNAITKLFVSPIAMNLEQQLIHDQTLWLTKSSNHQNERGDYYRDLRNYLLVCYPQRADSNFDVDSLAHVWVTRISPSDLDNPLQNDHEAQLLAGFYLKENKRSLWQPNFKLIEQSRNSLRTADNDANREALARSMYINTMQADENFYQHLYLQNLISYQAGDVFQHKNSISTVFTPKLWQNTIYRDLFNVAYKAMESDWVINEPIKQLATDKTVPLIWNKLSAQDKKQFILLLNKVKNWYFSDYATAWLGLLQQSHLFAPQSLNQASELLRVISNPKGPITQALQAITQQASIANIYDFSNPQKDRPQKITIPGLINYNHFVLTNLPQNSSGLLNQYFQALKQLQLEIQQIALSPNVSQDAENYAAKILAGKGQNTALYKVNLAAAQIAMSITDPKLQSVMHHLLLEPVRGTWRVLLIETGRALQKQWQLTVYRIYQQQLQPDFPFTLNGTDAIPQEVNNFLNRQSGIYWQFIQQTLAPFLQRNQLGWQAKSWLHLSVPFTPAFLASITNTTDLCQAIYQDNVTQIQFPITIYPVPTPNLDQISLSLNGKTFSYRNGPQRWQQFSWRPHSENAVSLMVTSSNNNQIYSLEQQGPWAIFHLMAKAHNININNSTTRLIWNIAIQGKRYPITLLIKTGEYNVFQQVLVRRWSLPENILQNK